jgi:hypothetical protein
MELGGLGISSLKELRWALWMTWLWLQKTDPNRPWSALPIRVPDKVNLQQIADIAPKLYATIPTRRINKCTVHKALTARKWQQQQQQPSLLFSSKLG